MTNEVIRVIKAIFLNIKQISSFFMLISTSSSSPSILLFMTQFLPHLAHLLLMRSLKSLTSFSKMISIDSIFDADVSGIIFTFKFRQNDLLFQLLVIFKVFN